MNDVSEIVKRTLVSMDPRIAPLLEREEVRINATFKMTDSRGKYRYLLLHIRNRANQPQETEHYEFRSTEDYKTMQQLVRDFLAYIQDSFVEGDATLLIDLSNDPKTLPCLMQAKN